MTKSIKPQKWGFFYAQKLQAATNEMEKLQKTTKATKQLFW